MQGDKDLTKYVEKQIELSQILEVFVQKDPQLPVVVLEDISSLAKILSSIKDLPNNQLL